MQKHLTVWSNIIPAAIAVGMWQKDLFAALATFWILISIWTMIYTTERTN